MRYDRLNLTPEQKAERAKLGAINPADRPKPIPECYLEHLEDNACLPRKTKLAKHTKAMYAAITQLKARQMLELPPARNHLDWTTIKALIDESMARGEWTALDDFLRAWDTIEPIIPEGTVTPSEEASLNWICTNWPKLAQLRAPRIYQVVTAIVQFQRVYLRPPCRGEIVFFIEQEFKTDKIGSTEVSKLLKKMGLSKRIPAPKTLKKLGLKIAEGTDYK